MFAAANALKFASMYSHLMKLKPLSSVNTGVGRDISDATAEARESSLTYMPQVLSRSDAKRNALNAATQFIDKHEARFWRGARDLKLSLKQEMQLERLVSDRRLHGYLPTSNRHVRLRAQEALIEQLHELFARSAPELKLLTLTWDAGLTFEDRPVVDIAAMISQASRAIAGVGLNAICAIEVDGLSRVLEGEHARRLIFHIHAVCWTSGGPFSSKAKERTIAAQAPPDDFRHAWGVSPVRFTAKRKLDWVAVAGLGMYLLKAPRCLKKRVWRGQLQKFKLLKAPAEEYRPAAAVRLMDLHSRWDVRDIVFGVGVGVSLYEAWKHDLLQKFPGKRSDPAFDKHSVKRLWRGIYNRAINGCWDGYGLGDVRI